MQMRPAYIFDYDGRGMLVKGEVVDKWVVLCNNRGELGNDAELRAL